MNTPNKTPGIWFKGHFVPVGGGIYLDTSPSFYHGAINGISRCLKAEYHDAGTCVEYTDKETQMKRYRIRKLTPTECFRLMGVEDADIKKIQDAGISDSQQYRMAGNSIVVDVLAGIFTQMFASEPESGGTLFG